MWWVVALAALASCGRVGFDGRVLDGASGDGAPNGDGAPDDMSAGCAGYDLCDGFEGGTFDPVWEVASGVTLDGARAHRGTSSVRLHLEAFPAGAERRATLTERRTLVTLDRKDLWVRAWFYLGALPAGSNGVELISFKQPATGSEDGNFIFAYRDDVRVFNQFSNDVASRGDILPTQTWLCLVVHLVRSTGTTGELALTGESFAPLATPTDRTDGNPLLSDLVFGLGFSAPNVDVAQPAIDLWLDDVIVHAAEVTCTD